MAYIINYSLCILFFYPGGGSRGAYRATTRRPAPIYTQINFETGNSRLSAAFNGKIYTHNQTPGRGSPHTTQALHRQRAPTLSKLKPQ